jgi:nucleoid-associated protein YgaU
MYSASKPAVTNEAGQTAAPSASAKVGDVAVEVKDDGKKYPTELPDSYTVEKGDHLWKIAEKFYGSGYNWQDIAKENNLKNPGMLNAGQELKLPKVAVVELPSKKVAMTATASKEKIEGESYIVVKGDNLWSIAVRAYGDGFKWSEIAKANEIKHPNVIEVGQEIKLAR